MECIHAVQHVQYACEIRHQVLCAFVCVFVSIHHHRHRYEIWYALCKYQTFRLRLARGHMENLEMQAKARDISASVSARLGACTPHFCQVIRRQLFTTRISYIHLYCCRAVIICLLSNLEVGTHSNRPAECELFTGAT